MSDLDDKLREILADTKAKIVNTMNSTAVVPGSTEIELTDMGGHIDGDIVSVQIGDYTGHPSYTGSLKGYKIITTRTIPYKIDVGTPIRLTSWPEAIAQIKQAFADEGYVHTDVRESADKLLQGIANLRANTQHDLIRLGMPPTAKTHVTADFSKGELSKLMTGQEWYERFEKELYKPEPQVVPINHNDDGESHDRFFRAGGANFMYNKALEAAKRAAGVGHE